jgi:glycosyltransferase involved in cell wall biosynthesis
MLDEIGPSVIYQRGPTQMAGNRIVLHYARKKSIPFVYALSSDSELNRWHEIGAAARSVKPVWKKVPMLPYALWREKVRGETLRGAAFLVAQHEGQQNRVRTKLNREAELLRTIHPELGRSARKGKEKVVLWAANYRPGKRGELFVRLARRCRSLDCRFTMISGGTKGQYLEPVLREAGGLENLSRLGEVSSGEVEQLLEESALFVNTSEKDLEGFPNTFVQAWLRETPVISLETDPGGVIVREGLGRLSGSFERMVEDVAWFVGNDREREAAGKRARAYAEKHHGMRTQGDVIERFFLDAARGRPGRPR